MGLARRAMGGNIPCDLLRTSQRKGAGMALKKLSLALLVLLTACVVAGCNTVEGLGKDIQSGGQTIEDAAH
jgi:predicted small secreted protein